MSEDGSVEPVSEETAVVETSEDAVASEECNNPNCDVHGHTWWCSTSKFWRHTLHMKARRKTNNQSFYRNVPAYNVENYGFYRTCWRRLQDCDCCPEDVVHNENTLPAEAEPTEK